MVHVRAYVICATELCASVCKHIDVSYSVLVQYSDHTHVYCGVIALCCYCECKCLSEYDCI